MVTWNIDQAERVEELLEQFNGAEEIAACMECRVQDLDEACDSTFGMNFKETEKHFHAIGRAMIRDAQFKAALNGDRSMLLALGREQLGQDTDASRKKSDDYNKGGTVLELVKGKYGDAPDRKSTAAG